MTSQRGFTLIDALVAVAVAALLAAAGLALFARRESDVRAAAVDFQALLLAVEARAAANAAAPPGTSAATGMTIGFAVAGPATVARVFLGRPEAGVPLPLPADAAFGPVTLPAAVSAGGARAGTPFALFVGSGGSIGLAPGFDPAVATQSPAVPPSCAPGASVSLIFANAARSETDSFECATGRLR